MSFIVTPILGILLPTANCLEQQVEGQMEGHFLLAMQSTAERRGLSVQHKTYEFKPDWAISKEHGSVQTNFAEKEIAYVPHKHGVFLSLWLSQSVSDNKLHPLICIHQADLALSETQHPELLFVWVGGWRRGNVNILVHVFFPE